jgi:hypothetical protein
MSLNWSVEKVKGWQELNAQTTETIVWETMVIGIGEITEKNVTEVAARSEFFRKTVGMDVIPVEEFRKRIGLKTNVSKEAQGAWLKRISSNSFAEITRRIEREGK